MTFIIRYGKGTDGKGFTFKAFCEEEMKSFCNLLKLMRIPLLAISREVQ